MAVDPVTAAAQVTADLDGRALAGLVGEMPPDVAADVLADLAASWAPSPCADADPPRGDDGATGRPEPITVRADMYQEEIAAIFADYDLLALPVVDEHDELIGQVTVDDIVDVIHEEATEDNLKMAALSPLVLFVPAIMAMDGNSGIQTSTVTVRALATGALPRGRVGPALRRELRAAAGIGLLLGTVVFLVARVWTDGSPVVPCAGFAMFAEVLLSAGIGAVIPPLLPGHGPRSRRRLRP